jgi:hypothetical protein
VVAADGVLEPAGGSFSAGVVNPAAGVFSNGTVGPAAVVLSVFAVSVPLGGVLPAGGSSGTSKCLLDPTRSWRYRRVHAPGVSHRPEFGSPGREIAASAAKV